MKKCGMLAVAVLVATLASVRAGGFEKQREERRLRQQLAHSCKHAEARCDMDMSVWPPTSWKLVADEGAG